MKDEDVKTRGQNTRMIKDEDEKMMRMIKDMMIKDEDDKGLGR